jgi:hypothetical protein
VGLERARLRSMLGQEASEGFPDSVVPAPVGATAVEVDASDRTRAPNRWARLDARARREIIIGLALLFCYGFFRQVPAWNEYSRYDLVRALVEDNSTRIDRFAQNTGDKAFYDGHYFSDKAPGTALIGVPVYRLLTLSFGVAGAGTPDPQTAVEALAFVESGIPTVLLVLLLLRFLRPAVGEGWAIVVSIGYGLGSIAFPFATMFFGHAASAFFLFSAFYLLWQWRVDRHGWRPLLAGFLAACAVLVEMPVVLGVAVLGLYALWLGRRQALRFIVGGIPILMVLMAYNWLTFGSPLSIGYQYATIFGQQNSEGIFSIVWPSLTTTADLLFSPRGLLRLAPWFCLAPFGVLACRRRSIRTEVLVCVGICAVFLAYNSGALNPFGGWTPGPRYLLPALPFAAILVALAPRASRPFAALLMAFAIAIFFVATTTMPNAPEAIQDPLTELWLPRILDHDIADTIAWQHWGLHGIEPLLALMLVVVFAGIALLATLRATAAARRLGSVVAVGLVLMIGTFAFPFVPAPAFAIGGTSAQSIGMVAIVEIGATPDVPGAAERLTLWAQMENRGPAFGGTRVVFAVLATDGGRTWSAWYDNVSWLKGERKRLEVEWDPRGVPPGEYRVSVTVASTDLKSVYTSAAAASVVRIGP